VELHGVDGIADLKKQAGRDIILWSGPTAAAAAIELLKMSVRTLHRSASPHNL
jgi:hypothetical protein